MDNIVTYKFSVSLDKNGEVVVLPCAVTGAGGLNNAHIDAFTQLVNQARR